MSNRSKDRTNLCAFPFADGRHCRMPRCEAHPFLCAFHARKEAQAVAGQQATEDIAYHLSGAFLTACDLSAALGRLFAATAQGQVKPKTAATLAYLGNTLVQTMRLAQYEYIHAFSADHWRKAVRDSHQQTIDHIWPDEASPESAPSESVPPKPAASAVNTSVIKVGAVGASTETADVPPKSVKPDPVGK